MKNGNPSRLPNNQNDLAGPDANNHPGMAHQLHASGFAPPSYGYAHHYARGPFHQHGGQQSPGMAAAAPSNMMEPYGPNSHDHGFPNHQYNNYGQFPNRAPYPGPGYSLNSPRSAPAQAAKQQQQQAAAGSPTMASSFNNQRYNVGNPQATSTPTLNQLLTSPSSSRGYGNYPPSDYSSQEGANKPELSAAAAAAAAQYAGAHPGWQQRTRRP